MRAIVTLHLVTDGQMCVKRKFSSSVKLDDARCAAFPKHLEPTGRYTFSFHTRYPALTAHSQELAVGRSDGAWLVEKWKRMLDFGVTLKSVLKDTCRG